MQEGMVLRGRQLPGVVPVNEKDFWAQSERNLATSSQC
jgi:hypothetical protein